MKLKNDPFCKIKNESKIIEMRLFDEKRQMAYKNEFTEAKKYFDDHKAPDNNLVQTTLNNTLKNKFVGKKEEDELNN